MAMVDRLALKPWAGASRHARLWHSCGLSSCTVSIQVQLGKLELKGDCTGFAIVSEDKAR
jgi:hypothetical protein